jgi:hypothetical protein
MIEPNDYVIYRTHNGFYVTQINDTFPTMLRVAKAIRDDLHDYTGDIYYQHDNGTIDAMVLSVGELRVTQYG